MGYIGNKMSVRAYEAYESGEKPLSKWTKNDIIECVLNVRNDFQEKESYGIIKGSWIYYKDGKKSLNGKYVHVVKKFERAPRGTAALFKQIEKKVKK